MHCVGIAPDFEAVGRFGSARFDRDPWVPELPDDEFWINPRAAGWITKRLIERRDKIGRAAVARVLPADRFELRNGWLGWEDLRAMAGTTEAEMPGEGCHVGVLQSPQRQRQIARAHVRKRGTAEEDHTW